MILRDFCSNPIEFHIPLRNSFIPVRNSKYQIGTLFFLWEKDVFLKKFIFFKGKYLNRQVTYIKGNGGFKLLKQWSVIWHIWIFRYMQLRLVQYCHLCTGKTIRHSVLSFEIQICCYIFIPSSLIKSKNCLKGNLY